MIRHRVGITEADRHLARDSGRPDHWYDSRPQCIMAG